MTPDTRRKALAILRSGRLTVLNTHRSPMADEQRPCPVTAQVRTSRPASDRTHVIDLDSTGWHCTCQTPDCPHIAATQLVTGHHEETP